MVQPVGNLIKFNTFGIEGLYRKIYCGGLEPHFLSMPICGPVGFAGVIERCTTFPSVRADTPSAAIPAGSFIKPASGAAEPPLFCRRPRSKDTGLWKRTNVETEIHQRCATVLFGWYSSIRANLTTSLLRSNLLRPRSVVGLIRVRRGFVAQTPNQLFMDIQNRFTFAIDIELHQTKVYIFLSG